MTNPSAPTPTPPTLSALWSEAADQMPAFRPHPAEEDTRIDLWKEQEYHNWLRWRICRKGFDWSKPGVILLLAAGFGALVWYGYSTGNWFVTAGGIVAWFTLVNLSFFTYFGLTLPGPPIALPKPAKPWTKYRAEMGLYPAGYERRKLARIWIRVKSDDGEVLRFELAGNKFPPGISALLDAQKTWRMQRGDAPLTHAVIETESFTRREIDEGRAPIKVIAWQWDEQALIGFRREQRNCGAGFQPA